MNKKELTKEYTIDDLKKAFYAGRKTYSRVTWGDDFVDEYTYESFTEYKKRKINKK